FEGSLMTLNLWSLPLNPPASSSLRLPSPRSLSSRQHLRRAQDRTFCQRRIFRPEKALVHCLMIERRGGALSRVFTTCRGTRLSARGLQLQLAKRAVRGKSLAPAPMHLMRKNHLRSRTSASQPSRAGHAGWRTILSRLLVCALVHL